MKKNQKISDLIFKCLKDPKLLNELKKDPKKFIEKELKIQLPQSYQLQVLEETAQKGYIVIPAMEVIKECSEEELKAIAAGVPGMTSYCSGAPCE